MFAKGEPFRVIASLELLAVVYGLVLLTPATADMALSEWNSGWRCSLGLPPTRLGTDFFLSLGIMVLSSLHKSKEEVQLLSGDSPVIIEASSESFSDSRC